MATKNKRREIIQLLAGKGVTYAEAARTIQSLKREAESLDDLMRNIIAADQQRDWSTLGLLLSKVRRTVPHGDWLPFLGALGMHPRKAQRLIARAKDLS